MESEIVNETAIDEIWMALDEVRDPEIPVISVKEMGIITGVLIEGDVVTINMTPTFVGCPAIDLMKKEIAACVGRLGYKTVNVKVDFENPWTSDKISAEAREKLEKFGLAPPAIIEGELTLEALNSVRCPHCGNTNTTLRSAFGSTLCRAIRYCPKCNQTFEQFKPV